MEKHSFQSSHLQISVLKRSHSNKTTFISCSRNMHVSRTQHIWKSLRTYIHMTQCLKRSAEVIECFFFVFCFLLFFLVWIDLLSAPFVIIWMLMVFYQCEPGHPQTLACLKVQKHLLHCNRDVSICKRHSPKMEIFKNRRYPKAVALFKQEVQKRHNKFELRRSTRVLHKTSFCLNVYSLNHWWKQSDT